MPELLKSLKSDWQLAQNGTMSRVPLYHQLYSVLKDAILDGTIPFGAQMPTEQQLTATFDVSRITAKRAMDELAAEQLVSRFRGKGSHVIYQFTPKPVRALLVGMLEKPLEIAKHGSVRVITTESVVPPANIRQIMNLGNSDVVHKVARVCSKEDGEPYVHYLSWTAGIKKGFTKKSLEKHMRLDLLRANGIHLVKVEQVITAKNASMRIAEDLEMEFGSALLSIRRIGYVESGEIVDVVDGLYNPERFQYAMVSSVD